MRAHVRRAAPADTRDMADLLNAIIMVGGTTARTSAVSAQDLAKWMTKGGDQAAWFLAENDNGEVLGFQWIEPNPNLPPEACDIATFVRLGQAGLGIGTRLFDATRAAAGELGYDWINASIRADNPGGLTYYQSKGFRVWNRSDDVVLGDGSRVVKISKRYDLKD